MTRTSYAQSDYTKQSKAKKNNYKKTNNKNRLHHLILLFYSSFISKNRHTIRLKTLFLANYYFLVSLNIFLFCNCVSIYTKTIDFVTIYILMYMEDGLFI